MLEYLVLSHKYGHCHKYVLCMFADVESQNVDRRVPLQVSERLQQVDGTDQVQGSDHQSFSGNITDGIVLTYLHHHHHHNFL